jgi:hypothetical protein
LENNYKKLSVPTTMLAAMELKIVLPTKRRGKKEKEIQIQEIEER